MTGQAPLHFQRAGAPGQRHLVGTTMARRTADALVDVDAVIKIDKVRKIVNALPRERRCGIDPGLVQRRKDRRGAVKLRVAAHADSDRRSEERRVGKGWGSTCRSWWRAAHAKKKNK